MRKLFISLLALAIIAIVALGSWYHLRPKQEAQASSSLLKRQEMFGISAGEIVKLPSDQQLSELQDMKSMGVNWLRYDLRWSTVQPSNKGGYDWSQYDRLIANMQTAGLQSLAILDYTPPWAQGGQCPGAYTDKCQPARVDDFANFARQAAQRYASQGIHNWEIWNEPNTTNSWRPLPNVALYTQLLQRTHAAIRAQDQTATIITGGIGEGNAVHATYDPTSFLKGIYDNGGKGSFEAVAVHPYTSPYSATGQGASSWRQMAAMHDLMAKNGDDNKQIWVTEYGAPTDGPMTATNEANPVHAAGIDHVSEDTQAQMLTEAVGTFEKYPWAGPFFWYNYKDFGTDKNNREDFFGLRHADGSPKPAYDAYKNAINSSGK